MHDEIHGHTSHLVEKLNPTVYSHGAIAAGCSLNNPRPTRTHQVYVALIKADLGCWGM